MSQSRKKSKFSVKYNPLGEGSFFDIKKPKKPKSHEIKKEGRSNELWRFFLMAFAIFVGLTITGIYMNGRSLITENKNIAFAGYDSLKEGVISLANQDFERAGLLFEGAEAAFQEVDQNVSFLTNQASSYLKANLYLDATQKLIESGVSVSKIGQELTEVMQDTIKIPSVFVQQNLEDNQEVKLTDLVRIQKERLERIMAETLLIQKNLTTLNADALPNNLKNNIQTAQSHIENFLITLHEVNQNFGTALKLLGDTVPHRYLVLLQNNHELRATGGFIGSYMLIDVNDGAIEKIETKDVYETDGQLTEIIPAPPGIDQLVDQLYMRDANYSPDFPTSAQQIMWLLEHSQGPSVDTVIAIDQTVAEKLLELTGPVALPNFPFIVRADNFNDMFSYHIEAKLTKTTTPKQLLIDFIPLFKECLLGLESFSELNNIAYDLISGRHIQVYSSDLAIQALAEQMKVDGRMISAPTDVDFLAIVTTAIGGNKSDAFIKTNLTHHTEISHMGEITDHLVIQKTHTWKEKDFAYWKKLIDRYGTGKLSEKTLRFIQGEGDNVDYMRVYVPKGSRLIGLEGLDIENLQASEDLGYTIFAFTFGPVRAGESKTINLSYKLSHKLSFEQPMDIYRFVAQKQAGTENVTLEKSLQTSEYLQVLETYPKIPSSPFTIYPQFETALDQNQIFLSAITIN